MATLKNTYQYEWRDTASILSVKQRYQVASTQSISFTVPQCVCKYANSQNQWTDAFEMETETKVYKQLLKNGVLQNTTEILTFYSGATNFTDKNVLRIYKTQSNKAYLYKIKNESPEIKRTTMLGSTPTDVWDIVSSLEFNYFTYNTSVVSNAKNEYANKTVSFSTDTLSPTEIAQGYTFRYNIIIKIKADTPSAILANYECKSNPRIDRVDYVLGLWTDWYYRNTFKDSLSNTITDINSFQIDASFICDENSSTATGGVFTRKGVPYNAYQLFRKAMLTTDAYLIDNDAKGLDEQYINDPASIKYPIKVSDEWAQRMSSERIFETVFEQKNLWEILLQIGYYLHAIPFLTFARDGTDAFLLTFRQLGKSQDDTRKEAGNTKLTVFNSLALDEYFANYDSYVTNLFSPQNICEEYLVVHTSDHSNLVSNDTAELHTAYAITEIVQFLIKIEINGVWREFDATNHLFEQSIYDVLSVANPYQVVPCKGTAIYYTLGGNKIQGFQFTPPSPDGTVYPLALQRIIEILTSGVSGAPSPFDIKYNDLRFFVKYRTQDYARLSQFRPDLDKFIKNNEIERYPHHAQFYGQQDKIIDSERFTANLHGKLVKVANALYQSQEYCENSGYEKESGDLIQIDGDPYYVTKVENEYYPDAIFQKVTYSKDFNQMSNIVTIPSEPRFYEVSERSKLRREIQIFDFFKLSGSPNPEAQPPTFLPSTEWYFMFVSMLLITPQHPMWSTFGNIRPNYAYIKFLADKKRMHGGYPLQSLFPSSELDGVGTESVTPKEAKDHTDVIVPVLHFPLRNGIVFEWDMEDNFKAGDFIDTAQAGGEDNKAYQAQQPMRYCDIFGRADLCQFRLFKKKDWTPSQLKKIINSGYIPPTNSIFDTQVYTKGNMSLAIDKDNREALSFNYQINLLFDNEFVTFPNLFGDKKGNLKFVCMDVEQNQFNKNIDLSGGNIISNPMPTQVSITTTGNEMSFNFGFVEEGVNYPVVFKNKDDGTPYTVDDVQSIVMYVEVTDDSGVATGEKSAYLVRNVGKVPAEDRLKPWYIYPVFNE